jgi:LacI family transcriptional regulator
MVSIKDIARHCGVSTATVSKALNGHRDVGENTRELVRTAAAELGYQPNSAARALKTNRTYNLGVLFVDEMQSGLTHEYFSAVLDSFKVEAEAHGYDITFITHNIGGRQDSYLEHCRYRGVDGVVVACVDFNDPQVLELVSGNLPVVTIDHAFHNRTAILSDNVRGMESLVRHVYAMGHRRIAFIHGERTAVTENRVTSFYRTCAELGLEIGDAYVREGVYHDPKTCAKLTREFLALNPRPTCILFPDDFSYIGGQNAILDAGLRIPEDISAMGYDGIYLSRVVSPSLTTYVQNTTDLGRRAAAELVRLVENPRTTLPERIIIDGTLQEGKSVLDLR